MKKIVVLSGAGVSAESGLKTFRDSDGLWEGYDVMEVATPEGWRKNPALVLEFYNQRRKQAQNAQPNAAHFALAELEKQFDVTIVTQNVDSLHEKAGSSKVIHLHGQLFQSRSTADENLIYDMDGWELKMGDKCKKGSQLRPNIVWFGEAVPMMVAATKMTKTAEIFIVVGTSLSVYPAASLIDCVPTTAPIYVVDPNMPTIATRPNLTLIHEKATTGIKEVLKKLNF